MCRLLAIASRHPIDVDYHLHAFTQVCVKSPEYQGHGWGYAVWRGDHWERYRSVQPIWSDDARPAGDVRLLLAHARSAFRNEDIVVENNMPFLHSDQAFIFNGELRGVRLPIQGRTGAHRLFRFMGNDRRQDHREAVERAIRILRQRTTHIRACNFVLANPDHLLVHSLFTGEPDYFTLHRRSTDDELVICSSRYEDDGATWVPIANDSLEEYPCS